jgi:hypothetical protein
VVVPGPASFPPADAFAPADPPGPMPSHPPTPLRGSPCGVDSRPSAQVFKFVSDKVY